MAVIYVTGFEHGVDLTASGGGLASVVSGTCDVQAVTKRSGDYALSLTNAYYTIPSFSAQADFTIRFYVYLAAGDGTSAVMRMTGASNTIYLYWVSATEQFMVYCSGYTSRYADGIVAEGWYRIDLTHDGSAGTIDWQVDGVAKTQFAGPAQNLTDIRFRSDAAGHTHVFDDIIITDSVADYPIGEGQVVGLSPNADGSHNAGTNVMEDQAGNDIGAVTAYSLMDDVPMTSTADYVRQAADGAANYAEVQFDDIDDYVVNGARAILAYHSEATDANDGETRIRDGAGQETVVFNGDMSESTLFYKSVVVTEPAAGWSQDTVNGLLARVGYSGDATPDPYFDALMIEVDIGEYLASASASASGAGVGYIEDISGIGTGEGHGTAMMRGTIQTGTT